MELLPCPFCEGGAFLSSYNLYHVYCKECHARTFAFQQEKHALEAWNTRPKVKHTFESLKELIKEWKESKESKEYKEIKQELIADYLMNEELLHGFNKYTDRTKVEEKEPAILPCIECGKQQLIHHNLLVLIPPIDEYEISCCCYSMKAKDKEMCIKHWNEQQSKPKYLSFEEALKLIREGKKVTHDGWNYNGITFYTDNKKINSWSQVMKLRINQILSDKWLEVKE